MSEHSTKVWSNPKKIGFRFAFSYIALYVILVNNGAYPFWYFLTGWLNNLMKKFIPWIGENILHLPEKITTFTNGSGDTTYDYVTVLLIFTVAVIATIIWSLLDRKRMHYFTLYYWITTAARYYVGLMLINYGLVKVIQLQFQEPGFYRLIQPYGDSSPMGLAWTFLGFSKGYNLFMGIAEVAAGFLLFRKTTTFGAIVTLMTTANVMAVNYFFDVPVKIVSTHLVLLTLFILSKDIPGLIALFFKGQAVQLERIKLPEIFQKKWAKINRLSIKSLLLLFCFGVGTYQTIQSQYTYGSKAPKPVLYGLYEIETFTKNGDTIPPTLGDKDRWRYIRMEWEGYFQVNTMNKEKRISYESKVDTLKNTITLKDFSDSTKVFIANYKKTDSIFTLSTIIEQDTLSLKARCLTKKDFLLTNRGFHWINERPFNR